MALGGEKTDETISISRKTETIIRQATSHWDVILEKLRRKVGNHQAQQATLLVATKLLTN